MDIIVSDTAIKWNTGCVNICSQLYGLIGSILDKHWVPLKTSSVTRGT